MFRIFIFLLLFSTGYRVCAQQKVTLNGYVRDAQNGEELIGASVYIPQLQSGVNTNAYGFYSLTVPPGTYELTFSYLGYTSQTFTVVVTENFTKNIDLVSEARVIQEIIIRDKPLDENIAAIQMSRNALDMNRVRKLPALFGEVDILKNIQMLPGVITAGEGTSAFFVRGGSADQNLILIDEAPIYDPSHLFGLFSVFNADVIKDSELYKGGIPSRFGGRLSSILDVRTKDGNNKNFALAGGIGTMASRVMAEGPLRKEKSSYIISARRSYADVFLRAADEDNIVYFYDVNAKVNWRYNNNNRFFVAFYAGRDVFSFGDNFGFGWGNATGTFRWNHLFTDKLFSNTSFIISNFDYKLELIDPVQGLKWTSNLQEVSLKNDLSYYINLNNELNFGYHLSGRRFSPGKIEPNTSGSIFETLELKKMYAADHAFYISNKQHVTDKLSLDYGVRLSIYQNVGKGEVYKYNNPHDNTTKQRTDTLYYDALETIKAYVNLEPRVGAMYRLSPTQSVKASYHRMVQNTHLIASGTVPIPFNTWSPSGYYLKPQVADQVAVGYFQNFNNNVYEFSVEAYYKDIKRVTDFADNAEIFFNEDLSTEFRQGKSWSQGLEFLINKKEGKVTGSMSYTLSKTMRKIQGVNTDKAFKANHDRRNVVNLNVAYDFSERWVLGAIFTYSTGRPITIPSGRYEYDGYNPDVITERNGYLLPAYHRLDLSATFNPRKNKNRKWKGQWVFAVYNAYNRQNPFTIYTRTKQDDDGNVIGDGSVKEARLVYLFPVLPSVTYNFKF
jgi:hypothetical protein